MMRPALLDRFFFRPTAFLYAVLLWACPLFFFQACKTTAALDEVKVNKDAPVPSGPKAETPAKPQEGPVAAKPVAPRSDTLVVLDTLRSDAQWIVLKSFVVDGKRVKSDTLRRVATKPVKLPPNPKSDYILALILPFRSGEYAAKGGLSKRSYLALDFYEGVKMAVSDLQKTDRLDIEILVLDSEPDSLGFGPVLDRPELLSADAIMGPANPEHLRQAAEFAKRRQIPLVSPINPKEALVLDNPFYVQLNPGSRAQLTAQLDYARTRYGNKARYHLAWPKDSAATEMAKTLISHFRAVDPRTPLLEYCVHRDSFQWADFRQNLSRTDTNVILVPSADEAFVPDLLRALSATTQPEPVYPLAVFGTQRWYELNRIGMDDLENLGVFIPMETFLSSQDETVVQWRYRFYQTYRFPPSEYVCKGYDYTRFVCRMLKKYGNHFPYHATDETGDYLSCPGFSIQPIYEEVPAAGDGPARKTIRQFENRRINILRFRDYRFQKAD